MDIYLQHKSHFKKYIQQITKFRIILKQYIKFLNINKHNVLVTPTIHVTSSKWLHTKDAIDNYITTLTKEYKEIILLNQLFKTDGIEDVYEGSESKKVANDRAKIILQELSQQNGIKSVSEGSELEEVDNDREQQDTKAQTKLTMIEKIIIGVNIVAVSLIGLYFLNKKTQKNTINKKRKINIDDKKNILK